MVEKANRLIKGTLQLAITSNLCVEKSLCEMVWACRTTPDCTAECVPSTLMRGREPSMKLVPARMKNLVEKSLISTNQNEILSACKSFF